MVLVRKYPKEAVRERGDTERKRQRRSRPCAPGRKALNHRRREIAGVLVRRGWGYVPEASGLEHLTALEPHLEGPHHATAPERLRLALEELGPTSTVTWPPSFLQPPWRDAPDRQVWIWR